MPLADLCDPVRPRPCEAGCQNASVGLGQGAKNDLSSDFRYFDYPCSFGSARGRIGAEDWRIDLKVELPPTSDFVGA